jgi:hypothetical protein
VFSMSTRRGSGPFRNSGGVLLHLLTVVRTAVPVLISQII